MEKRLHLLFFLFSAAFLLLACSRQVSNLHQGNNIVIYPPPPDTTRIQFLTTINNSVDITGKRSGFARFVLGSPKPAPILKPYGIAINKGKIYVCDVGIAGLEVMDLETKHFDYFIPKGRGQLKIPSNCFVDDQGSLYVADPGRRQIVVFDAQGQYLDAFGEAGESKPTDVAVMADKIWVPDSRHHSVNVYQKTSHKLLFSFPDTTENAEYHLFQPVNICVTNERVYVTDFGDFKVKIFNLKGEFLSSVGSFGNSIGQFVRPKGIAADKDANLFAVDAAFDNVQIFNKKGQLLMFFGGSNNGSGEMGLPAKVVIDYDDFKYFQQYLDPAFSLKYLILVTNQYGPDKINVYGAVELKKK